MFIRMGCGIMKVSTGKDASRLVGSLLLSCGRHDDRVIKRGFSRCAQGTNMLGSCWDGGWNHDLFVDTSVARDVHTRLEGLSRIP